MLIRSPEHWQQLDTLLDQALGRPADERTAYLRATCGHDVALYNEAVALLARMAEAEAVLGESVTTYAEPFLDSAAMPEAPPSEVGSYRIVRELGRGGMGTVYLAKRADGTFEKEVALKLVKRGMDTDEVLHRFQRERQILAALDHPGIARLLDAGAAPDGRPFLVMEYVEGEPLTAYADRKDLDLEGRLVLFVQVCEAVQHAHRRLVIHRDLKPSNILVSEAAAGQAQVKLLDFGIARLLDSEADDVLTQTGMRRMTPAYAAPEQIQGGAVTTATDVYALGVVLHELLTGQRATPEPKPPSALIARESLRRRIQGDLDTITLKALRAGAEDRYPSVEALLEDLRRHRERLPLHARPASVGYRVRKFVVRHRVGVTAAALVALALVGGLGTALWQADLAARERDEAETIAVFLEDLLAAPDPVAEERRDTLSVHDVLAQGMERAETELAEQPLLQARLLYVMGRTYRRMQELDEARSALEQALSLQRTHLGARHEDVAETLRELGLTQAYQEVTNQQAVDLLQEALGIQRERLGEQHPRVAATLVDYADVLTLSSDIPAVQDEAEELLCEALAIQRATYEADNMEIARTLDMLGHVSQQRQDVSAAVTLYEQALAIRQRLHGEEHPTVASSHRTIAWALIMAGQPTGAEEHARAALDIERATYGEHTVPVREGLTMLASALRMQHRYDEAEAVLREALATGGRSDASHAITLGALASVLREKGELVEAEQMQRETIAVLRRQNQTEPTLAFSLAKLADILHEQGREPEAEQVLIDGLDTLREAHGAEHPAVQYLVQQLEAF